MKYLIVTLAVLLAVACSPEVEEVEKVVEVPIPTAPPANPPPPLQPSKPDFLNYDLAVQLALNDANSLPESTRLESRYLLLTNFYNSGDPEGVEFGQAGINKTINMLSTERLLAYGTPIDSTGSLVRINLGDFGVTRSLWQKFERENLVGFIPEDTRGITLRYLTQTNQPLVFATSFALTALGGDLLSVNNGLYYDFLRQPSDLDEFFSSIGVDIQNDVDNSKYHCAGGGNSRIALSKHRLVCIVDTARNGFLMSTYDTSLSNQDNLFANPFTKEMASAGNIERSKRIFGAVAQEHIYSLDNGLLVGYRLNGFLTGAAEVIAPTEVVIDVESAAVSLPVDIMIGSCAGCHHTTAAIAFNDGVGRAIEQSGAFGPLEKEIGMIVYRNDAFQAKLATANRQHTQALAEIGVSTLEQDPVTRGLMWRLRGELDVNTVASYTFLTVDEFKKKLAGTNRSKLVFGDLLNPGGTVQLADLVRNFDTLVEELLLFQDVNQF